MEPSENPRTIARVAPNPAPEDIPMVYGDARGLFMRLWTATPQTDREAPAMQATSILGSLTWQTT